MKIGESNFYFHFFTEFPISNVINKDNNLTLKMGGSKSMIPPTSLFDLPRLKEPLL